MLVLHQGTIRPSFLHLMLVCDSLYMWITHLMISEQGFYQLVLGIASTSVSAMDVWLYRSEQMLERLLSIEEVCLCCASTFHG